jgi:hypothetical protein
MSVGGKVLPNVDARIKESIVDARINKVLAMRTDSVSMLESLSAISDFFGKDGNTVEARRSLRHDVEMQNILLAKNFLKEFDEIKSRIDRIDDHTAKLEAACAAISSKVNDANENMNLFMKKATELEGSRNKCLQQSKDIAMFLQKYELSADEIKILQDGIVDQRNSRKFFDALSRLRSSYKECKKMVESNGQSIGFELLDSLGHHQDVAYQRLFAWVKAKCEELGTSADDVDAAMLSAMQYLKEIPVYYAQCQELVAASQRTLLVQRFVIALTQGGGAHLGGGLSSFRAIEMHSHDALRYVGDMLAWTHQAIASEEELLLAFFGSPKQRGKPNVVEAAPVPSDASSGDSGSVRIYSVPELLVRCLQGLGRPLKVRIVQTLEARSQSVEVLFALLDLFTFYEETFEKLLGKADNAIHLTVSESLSECRRLLSTALSRQAESMVQSASSLHPTDLGASYNAKECARQIREILKHCKAALAPGRVGVDDELHVNSVLGAIIRPLLQACRTGSQALPSADMAIFMLNNVSVIQVFFVLWRRF